MPHPPASHVDCPLPPPVGQHPSRGGVVLRLALALLAFGLVQALLRSVAAPGGGTLIGSKVQHLEMAADRYDTVFLGSSHVYRSFVPDEFDAALGEVGLESAAFNFGIPLPSTVELHHLLRTALEGEVCHLKRVFVQYYDLVPQVDPDQAFKARSVYWHDWTGTKLAVERAWELDCETPDGIHLAPDPKRRHAVLGIAERWLPSRYYLARQHFQHLIKRQMLVARAEDVIRGVLGRPYGMTAQWRDTSGYTSLEDDLARRGDGAETDNAFKARREIFVEERDEYLNHVERLRNEALVWGDKQWMNAELARFNDLEVYRSMVEMAQAAGVELVVVVMPSNSCDREFEDAMEQELGVSVLRYNDPDKFPQFYDPSLRFDSGHLTAEGASRFTRRLAADYLALSKGE